MFRVALGKQRFFLLVGSMLFVMILVEEILNHSHFSRRFLPLPSNLMWQNNVAVDEVVDQPQQPQFNTKSHSQNEILPQQRSTETDRVQYEHLYEISKQTLRKGSGNIRKNRTNMDDIYDRLVKLQDKRTASKIVGSGPKAAEQGRSEVKPNKDRGGSVEEKHPAQTLPFTDKSDDDEIGIEDDAEEYERLRKSPYIVDIEEETKRSANRPHMVGVKQIGVWGKDNLCHHDFSLCRYSQCQWQTDLSKADAVLFRASAIRTWIIDPFKRKDGQRWIVFTNDPAIKQYGFERPDVGSNFNATTTYQIHSRYHRPFGYLARVTPPVNKDFGKLFQGKSKQIAWFVSHCKTWSKREEYVERMRKIIPVDVFGACGNMTCGLYHRKGNDSNVCLPMLSEQYKFYLAFENSFCRDYVSEKFFKLFKDVDVIPIVQGGFDYRKYMPSNIYVDSSDFKTPEALAEYLLRLSADKERYVNMLKRKARWTYYGTQRTHCAVCEKLHTDNTTHVIQDLYAEFNGKPPECYPPPWQGTYTGRSQRYIGLSDV